MQTNGDHVGPSFESTRPRLLSFKPEQFCVYVLLHVWRKPPTIQQDSVTASGCAHDSHISEGPKSTHFAGQRRLTFPVAMTTVALRNVTTSTYCCCNFGRPIFEQTKRFCKPSPCSKHKEHETQNAQAKLDRNESSEFQSCGFPQIKALNHGVLQGIQGIHWTSPLPPLLLHRNTEVHGSSWEGSQVQRQHPTCQIHHSTGQNVACRRGAIVQRQEHFQGSHQPPVWPFAVRPRGIQLAVVVGAVFLKLATFVRTKGVGRLTAK